MMAPSLFLLYGRYQIAARFAAATLAAMSPRPGTMPRHADA
jgi:hypothetical protein